MKINNQSLNNSLRLYKEIDLIDLIKDKRKKKILVTLTSQLYKN